MEATFITGNVEIKTEMNIEELGKILSSEIFAGVEFEGKELNLYDEVPAVFIKNGLLGLSIVLQGEPGFKESNGYSLEIIPDHYVSGTEELQLNLDKYLNSLLKEKLKEISNILIVS